MKGKVLLLAIAVTMVSLNAFSLSRSVNFEWEPETPTDVQSVHFLDRSTGDIIAWIWYFGDGNSSTEQNPWHRYADNGVYDVRLVVIFSDGNVSSMVKQINVLNVPPVAVIGGKKIYNNRRVSFVSASYDRDGSITSCEWEFGDGDAGNGCTVEHEYANDGIYTVNLTVTDNDGASNTTNSTIMIDSIPPSTSYDSSCHGWCNEHVFISLNATDNLSGINYTKYKIDDGEWKIYNATIVISSEGIHKLYFYSVDRAGNEEEEKNITVKIDKTKPSINLEIPEEGYIYIANHRIMPTLLHHTIIIGKLIAEASANDDVSGVYYIEFILNGKPLWKDFVSPYNAELPQEFPLSFSNTLKAMAYDNAGNYRESQEITYLKIA